MLTYHTRSCMFSPRARGCSYEPEGPTVNIEVFPACAGMFLRKRFRWASKTGFPRVRGDVPPWFALGWHQVKFSPRARGCSAAHLLRQYRIRVFPACAGMFRSSCLSKSNTTGFPRVRGDVPPSSRQKTQQNQFSPRARGCSRGCPHQSRQTPVFPSCAGMFRRLAVRVFRRRGFPRVRGDVPIISDSAVHCGGFSPRARGCSVR